MGRTRGAARPTAARLAWRLLKAFLGWCAEQPEYAPVLPSTNPGQDQEGTRGIGQGGRLRDDSLLKERNCPYGLPPVRSIGNQTVAAYLQTLLLTGARPGEVLEMRWNA